METFIFNLNKNQKYKKIKSEQSIFCHIAYGPFIYYFGSEGNTMKSIFYNSSYTGQYYVGGSEILPNNNQKKNYDLLEIEVYKIIIE